MDIAQGILGQLEIVRTLLAILEVAEHGPGPAAVGIELSNKGFTVIDSATTSKLMIRLNLNEVEIMRPEGLSKLKAQGIDAFLTVRAAGGYDQQPQSATARVNSTHTGQVIAGIPAQSASLAVVCAL